MAEDTLFNAIRDIDIKDIETIKLDGYIKAIIESGEIKNRREAIRHIEKVLDELVAIDTVDSYRKCAWLRDKLVRIKTRVVK